MALMGGPMVAFMYHLSNPNKPLFLPLHILLFLAVLLAIISSFFILNKSNRIRTSIFIFELITIAIVTLYLEPRELMLVVAVFTGAFWGSIKYLSMDFFETNKELKDSDDKKIE